MAIGPPGFMVAAPPLNSIPRYGLLSVVPPVELDDPHAWAGGVEWEEDICSSVESYVENCPPATGHVKSVETDLEFCHADPFIIKASYKCSTGGRSVSESVPIARRRLLLWEPHELERVLWTGNSVNGPVNPSLAFGNDTCEITPTILSLEDEPLTVVGGMAILEEALTDVVPGGGLIHAPFGLASYLTDADLLERVDSRYYSPTGFPFILGSGYPGSGPGNVPADPGTTWVFGTGPLGVWRSELFMNPPEISEGIDRYRNDITIFAERFYVVGFSCALFAVQVHL